MSINNQLTALYEKYWADFIRESQAYKGPEITNPMLLRINEEQYLNADLKVVICGQETWQWGKFGSNIKETQDLYHRFFINEGFYTGYGKSSFWKAFRYFQNGLEKKYPNKRIEYVWQNISKIGRNDGKTGVTNNIRKLEREAFPVFSAEMKILNPDIVLLFTGPNRDHDIRFHFQDVAFQQTSQVPNKRQLCKVTAAQLPEKTLRSYHPSYFGGFNRVRKIMLSMI